MFPADWINPKLPGFGINCQPIGKCLTRVSMAMKGIMKMVWEVLKIPFQIIWICMKALLEKWNILSTLTQTLNKLPSFISRIPKRTIKIDEEWKMESAPELVPISESTNQIGTSCSLCNLRLQCKYFFLSIALILLINIFSQLYLH